MHTFTISADDSNVRLDRFLADSLTQYTRGEIVREIKNGAITCNGKSAKPSYKLHTGDELLIPEIAHSIDDLIANPAMSLEIVDENENFLVINKPRGIQVHPSHTEKLETIANALIAHYPEIATVGDETDGPQMRPGIMSRLDKYTSGLMVIAKNQEAFDTLKEAFADRKVHKVYHALIWGEPKESEAVIDAPIARAVGYTRQKVAFGKFTGDAKEARTAYTTIASYDAEPLIGITEKQQKTRAIQEPRVQRISHVEVRPETGRMHQIRVHMGHIGRSIIGDVKYERKNERILNKKLFEALPQDDFHTFYLHAKELSFELSGEKYSYALPLPEHFNFVLNSLQK